jgi:hypothetical protein
MAAAKARIDKFRPGLLSALLMELSWTLADRGQGVGFKTLQRLHRI